MEKATEQRKVPRIAGANRNDCQCDLCSAYRRINHWAAPRIAEPLTDDQLWGV